MKTACLFTSMPLAPRRQRDGPWPSLEDRSMPDSRFRSDTPARVSALQHLRYLVRVLGFLFLSSVVKFAALA